MSKPKKKEAPESFPCLVPGCTGQGRIFQPSGWKSRFCLKHSLDWSGSPEAKDLDANARNTGSFSLEAKIYYERRFATRVGDGREAPEISLLPKEEEHPF